MIDYKSLTYNYFPQFKQSYTFYGTHTEIDKYGNEHLVADGEPRQTIHTMWHPLEDRVYIAEYGRDFDQVLYCIAYGIINIQYGDRVDVDGETYEVATIRSYNTHKRIEIRRMKVEVVS